MAKKSADLRQAMLSGSEPATRAQWKLEEAQPPEDSQVRQVRTGREGKSNVTGYFPPEVKKQLRLLAAERNTTIQDLLAEALNDLFAKNGKPELAPRF